MADTALKPVLRILMLEDSVTDAELAERALRKEGIDFVSQRVETRDAFIRALAEFQPDIVLADFNLPDFDGMAALQIVRRDYPQIPLIISSGVLTDVDAVALLKAGARDYILKDRLVRLPAAVQNAILVERGIRERKAAEMGLRESEERLRLALNAAKQAWFDTNVQTGEVKVSDEYARLIGFAPDDFETNLKSWWSALHPDDYAAVAAAFQICLVTGGAVEAEYRRRTQSGGWVWLHSVGKIVEWDSNQKPLRMVGIHMDISERKQAEAKLNHANRALATVSAVDSSLVHAINESGLLQAVCQAIINQGGYRMAWVGYLEQDAQQTIRPVAQAGFGDGYLEQSRIFSWADNEYGRGPIGRAARSATTQITQNIQSDDSMILWREEALKRGYSSSVALPLIEEGKVFAVLNIYAVQIDAFFAEEISLLEQMAGDLAFGITALRARQERDLAKEKIRQQMEQLENSLVDTVRAMSTIVELRDPYTAGHEARVADLSVAIARKLGLSEDDVRGIFLAGTVHDLGKIQIPAEILSKPGKINAIEYSLIKNHPWSAYEILKSINFVWPIDLMVLQHHERMDGSGYPQGLKGDQIILGARILGVADVVEAMSSHRPYRPGLGVDAALDEIIRGRGTIYDAQVVDACVALFKESGYVFPK